VKNLSRFPESPAPDSAPSRNERHRRPGRFAGWGALVLALLIMAGCSQLDRDSSDDPAEVANEPEFRLVTVTVAVSPTPRITEIHYTVVEGDTLSGIAEMFGVSWDAIIQANNLQSQDAIFVGQELIIPAPASPEAVPTSE
jgi:LysM repeat protein